MVQTRRRAAQSRIDPDPQGLNENDFLHKVDRLLWQKAWLAYRRLPSEVQVWLELEDLHAEAQLQAVKCLRRWNPKRGSQLTFVFVGVQNHLSSLVTRCQAKKRFYFSAQWVDLDKVDEIRVPRTIDLFIDPIVQWAFSS